MGFSERELEDWMFDNPRSCGMKRWIARQLSLPSGTLDLFGEDQDGDLWVYELKADKITSSALTQVSRYASDLEQITGLDVSKACVGTMEVSTVVQFEADALCITLKSASPSFSISQRWGFTTEAHREFEKQRDMVKNLGPIRDLILRDSLRSHFWEIKPKDQYRKLAYELSQDFIDGGNPSLAKGA